MQQLDLADERVALVRLDGRLAVETAPAVRLGLLKAIAAQPNLIVAEVSRLSVDDDVVLSVFPAVARYADAWPGIPLVLAAPGPGLAAALDRMAICRSLPVFGSVPQACRAFDRTPQRRLADRLIAGPDAVGAARALVVEACTRWSVSGLCNVAELIATELVSNAVRHAGGLIDVQVSLRRRYLHLSVRDKCAAPPRLGHRDGRGLLLVEAMTVAWGSTAIDDGKIVWATLRLP